MKKNHKTARAVLPSKGLEVAYRKALDALIAEMANSAQYWIEAAYKANPPKMAVEIAEDAKPGRRGSDLMEWAGKRSPSTQLQKVIKELTARWVVRFDEMSEKIARKFADGGMKYTDSSFKQALKDAGFTVEMQVTPVMRDAMNATIEENVGLIKSIPQQYFAEVEGIVMRGFTSGGDLQYITENLAKRYDITKRRAALIARDQTNKLNATVIQARRVDLGLFKAVWVHSGAGKHPRPDHVKAGRDKLEFDVREGAYLGGKWILPGQEVNCRCSSKTILPF